MDVELLRVRAGGQVANDLVGGDIEDLHRIVVARADEECFPSLASMMPRGR